MQTSRSSVPARTAAAVLVALPAAFAGCSAPTAPTVAPSGGQQLVLSYAEFASAVEPILVRQGCDAAGDCHGGGIRGTLELSPPGSKDVRYDFDQIALQVWITPRDNSPVLTEPLAISAGGTPHGFKPFASVTDSDYVAIRQWVDAGQVR
jgi:hypothetical protein